MNADSNGICSGFHRKCLLFQGSAGVPGEGGKQGEQGEPVRALNSIVLINTSEEKNFMFMSQ